MENKYDVAIIGEGRRTVALVDDGHQRNRPVRESHGFLGHGGLSPGELLQRARAQLQPYPTIEMRRRHVDDVSGASESFTLHMRNGDTMKSFTKQTRAL